MIKPSVGRVVWVFQPSSAADSHLTNGMDLTQPEPAFITYVEADDKINVAGFTRVGQPFALNGLLLVQDEKPAAILPYAVWMPFQIGQAKAQADLAAASAAASKPT